MPSQLRVRDLPQLNIRISPEVAQIFEAAAFVHGYRGFQELVEPVVAARARELSVEAAVQAAMAAKKLAQGSET